MKLFDMLFSRAIERRISGFQNDLITNHVAEVENIYRQMRGWRHDYHNHIGVLKAYISLDQHEKISDYLDELDADLSSVDTLIKSGNVTIDAILNSKLSLAKARAVKVNAKAIIPSELTISEIDLCVIIGNLLDNAIEASVKVKNETDRFIRLYMDIKRNSLYLSVTNASAGEIKRGYLSSKGENHGFGLVRVDKIVAKYEGYIKRSHEEGAFTSEVMLPL